MAIPPTEQGVGSGNMIPGWIKTNAGWWADGQIDDDSFVSGLQWLISNGIMKIFVIQLLKSSYNSLNIEKFWLACFLTQKESFEN